MGSGGNPNPHGRIGARTSRPRRNRAAQEESGSEPRASIPSYYEQLLTLTEPDIEDPAAVRTNLAESGLSVGFYAAYTVAVLEIATMLPWVAVGAAIFWRKSEDWMALFVALMLVTNGIYGAALEAWGTRPGWWLPVTSVGFLASATFGLFCYLFPDGRFVPRWTHWLAVPFVLFCVREAFFPDLPARLLFDGLFFVFAGTQVLSQVYRYRRAANPTQRQQIRWVVFGVATAILGLLSLVIAFPALDAEGSLADLVGETIMGLFLSLIPLSIGVAILRYRLWDIDLVINRTLVYGTLTVCVLGLYVLVVGYLGTLFSTSGNLAISLIATGLVAVLFAPLRDRVQKAVNRLMYGERDEPYAALSRLQERLEATLESEAILPTIAETVAQTLKVPYAAIALRQGGDFPVAAEHGKVVDEPIVLPLVYKHETVGQLLLAPRAGESDFSPTDRSLLEDLTRQAGIAVHAVRLTDEPQRSSERLVTAREEERRRLRRDLHDGLGPTLGSLPLKLDVAADLLESNPVAARELLRGLKSQAKSALTDIRRVVYELRPPALDELGLVGAVREAAAQHGANGLTVSVKAPEKLPPLPAAVEVAAYRITQEAMTNVVRHATANRCEVRIAPDDTTLRLEVADDGRGIGPDRGGSLTYSVTISSSRGRGG